MSLYDFTPKDWKDEPDETTPILSTDLERIEAGVQAGVRGASESQAGNVELASPTEMTTGTDLVRVPAVKRVADYVTAQIAAAVAALPTAASATETVSGVVELASPAEMTTGTDLARVPAVKRVADYVTAAIAASASTINASIAALSASTTSALGNKADKSGSWQIFSDVSDTAFTDGDVPMSESGVMQPIDISLNFAGLDASLRLDPSNFPQYYIPTVVIEEGSSPPGTFPSYGLVGKLPAAASLLPTFLDVKSVRAANNVVVVIPTAMVSGEYIGFTLGWSDETPFDHFSAAFTGTGPGAGIFDFGTLAIPNTTAGVLNGFVKLTANAAANSTITFTARDVSNNAINRVHLIGSIYSLQNLVSTSPRDQQGVQAGSGASSSTLTAVTAALPAPTTTTSSIIIGSALISAGTSPNLRDIAGTGPWAGGQIANHLSDNGTNGRRLWVGYQILNAIGPASLATLVSLSGTATQTGQFAAKIDAFKGL